MIVYSNSCSFGAPDQEHKIYPGIIAEKMSGKLYNDGMSGSCNRRIIRTSLRSLIELKESYSDILALIGLTFIGRTELWQPHLQTKQFSDGDFHSIHSEAIANLDWSGGFFTKMYPDIYKLAHPEVMDYYKNWLLHFSKEAAVTELLSDIIMLYNFAIHNDIKILIFSNCQKFPILPDVDREAPFLKSLVKYAKLKTNIIDPWEFSFADFALELGHLPKDKEVYGIHGHPNEQAHIDFSEYLLTKICSK